MVKVLLWAYFVASVVLANDNCNTDNIVAVQRRLEDFFYYQTTSNTTNCQYVCNDEGNETYLVAEQQCVNNSTLFSGKTWICILKYNHQYRFIECSFAITPTGEPHQLRITINAVAGTSRLQTFSSNQTSIDATVVQKSTNAEVNSSFCHISSLEVYRGREQTIEICHEGISLGNSGTIEV